MSTADHRAFPGKFDGIRNEIDHHLNKSGMVPPDRRQVLLHFDLDLDTLLLPQPRVDQPTAADVPM